MPEAVPEDLLIEMINSTTIKLSWILPNREKIWGHLKGFRVWHKNFALHSGGQHLKHLLKILGAFEIC